MLVDVLPFGVSGIGFFLEPCEEAAFLLLSVEEVVAFVHDALIASAAQCLGFVLRSKSLTLGNAQKSLILLSLNRDFLRHALVVVTLALVLGLGKDVDAKRLMSLYLDLRSNPLTLGNVQTSLALLSLNRGFHGGLIPVAGVVVKVEAQLRTFLYLTRTQGYCLTNVTHTCMKFVLLIIKGYAFDLSVFLLLARHSSSKLGSALASCVGS